MRRMAIAVLLGLAMLAMVLPTHAAEGDFVVTGTILVPDPASRAVGGITEQVSPCGGSIDPDVPDGTAQGVDGFWIALPENSGGLSATLTAPAPNEVDAWFYDDGCNLITPSQDDNAYSMATTDPAPVGDKAGVVPTFAAFAVIDMPYGLAAEFTFTILAAPAGE